MKIKFIKDYRFIGNDPDDGSDTTVKTGSVIDLENDESTKWLIDNGFAEEVKESGWWRPKKGDKYYFIDDSGYIKCDIWDNSFWEVDRYKMGNVFKTEEAADRYRDYMEAIATVRQDEGVLTPEQIREKESWHCDVYYIWKTIAGDCRVKKLDLANIYACPNAIFFDEASDAEASLEKHPDEWKIIANYDWSRE